MHIALYFWHTNPVITKNFISGGKYEQKLQQQQPVALKLFIMFV